MSCQPSLRWFPNVYTLCDCWLTVLCSKLNYNVSCTCTAFNLAAFTFQEFKYYILCVWNVKPTVTAWDS